MGGAVVRLLAAVAPRGPAARAPSGVLGGARVAGGCGVASVGGWSGAPFGFGVGREFWYVTLVRKVPIGWVIRRV